MGDFSDKTVLVLGASLNPERYAHKAILMLRNHGFKTLALGRSEGSVSDVPLRTQWPDSQDINTVAVYLKPSNQDEWMDRILKSGVKRLIFNPGSENPVFAQKASKAGILVEEACTLVLLSTGQF